MWQKDQLPVAEGSAPPEAPGKSSRAQQSASAAEHRLGKGFHPRDVRLQGSARMWDRLAQFRAEEILTRDSDVQFRARWIE